MSDKLKIRLQIDKSAFKKDLQQIQKLANNTTIDIKTSKGSKSMKNLSNSTKQAQKDMNKFGQSITEIPRKFAEWYLIGGAVTSVIRSIKEGIGNFIELDKKLVEIQTVTGKTRSETRLLSLEYNNLAMQLKSTTKEIADASVIFYRQGLSENEVMRRVQATTKVAKSAATEFEATANLLTSTVNGMEVDIDRAGDVFLKLGASAGTSFEEMATGLAKTASSAKTFGVDFEKVSSYLATVSEVTRESAESIGTSFKTIFARFNKINEDGEVNKNLNLIDKALKSVKISLTDTRGQIRPLQGVLDELGEKWGSLEKNTKAYLATQIAGTRQQSRFIALMDNYSRSTELYETALNAAGTTTEQYGKYLDSIEAKMNEFRATAENFWIKFLNSDAIKNFIELGTEAINVLDGLINPLIDTFGILPPIIFAVTTAFVGLNVKGIQGFISNVIAFPSYTAIAISEMGKMKGAAFALGTAFDIARVKAALLQAGLTLGLSVVITLVVSKLTKLIMKQKEHNKTLEETVQEISRMKDEFYTLEDLTLKYEDLIEKQKDGIDVSEDLLKVQRKLAQMHPELASGIDKEGKAIASNIDLVKEYTEEQRKNLKIKLENARFDAEQGFDDLEKRMRKKQNEIDALNKRISNGDTIVEKEIRGVKFNDDIEGELRDELSGKVEDLESMQEQYNNKKQAFVDSLRMNTEDLIRAAENDGKKFTDIEKQYINTAVNAVAMNGKSLEDQTKTIQKTINSITESGFGELYVEYQDLTKQMEDNPTDEIQKQLEKTQDKLVDLAGTIDGDLKSALTDSIELGYSLSESLENVGGSNNFLSDTYTGLNNRMKVAAQEQKLLNDSLKQLQTEGYLSDKTLELLTDRYPELAEATDISRDALINFIKQKKVSSRSAVEAEIKETKLTIASINDRIEGYKSEVDSLVEKLAAKIAAAQIDPVEAQVLYEKAMIPLKAAQSRLSGVQASLNASYAELAAIDALRERADTTGGSGSSGGSSSGGSTETRLTKINDRYLAINESLDKINYELERQKILLDSAEGLDKIDILNKINDLYDQQKTSLKALNDERGRERSSLRNSISDLVSFDSVTGEITDYLRSEVTDEQAKQIERYQELGDTINDTKLELLELDKAQKENNKTIMERQRRIEELQRKLANLQNNRDVQQLQKNADGSYQYKYVANQSSVYETQKELEELMGGSISGSSVANYQGLTTPKLFSMPRLKSYEVPKNTQVESTGNVYNIKADFPNVSSSYEIEKAFDSIELKAKQYTTSKG